jgi:hypothetical protein
MTAWVTIKPNDLIPSALVTAIKSAGSALSTALEAASAALTLPKIPSLPATPDPITAVVESILKTIEELLKGGRIHTLAIPITKQLPQPVPPPLPPTLIDLQDMLGINLGSAVANDTDAYSQLLRSSSGNAGFFNAFATSISDPLDLNRPQYLNQTDAVAMAVMLVGAPTYAAIAAAASTLDVLTTPRAGNTFAARTVPIPQNLRAKVVGASKAPGVGMHLDWDAPQATFSLLYFQGVAMTVTRYAIIRSTSNKVQSAQSVFNLFPTQALTEGLESTDKAHKVIAVGTGKNSSYLDADKSLKPGTTYYYTVAWEVSVAEGNTSTILPFDRLSNVVKEMLRAPTPAQTGASPNWDATDSAIDVFPTISRAANVMIEEARVLLKPREASADVLKVSIAAVNDVSKRAATRLTELTDVINRLTAALSKPIPSLYVTQMSSVSGGNVFLLAELAKRLNDRTDTSRPPFDDGQYVCGVCFVAGAPRLADLAAVIAFFETLFGPADATNPLLGVLDAIDTLVTQAETAVFQPNMTQFPPGTDLTNINPATGRPVVPSTPVVSVSGVPVATDSPENPNAGDTNVTPTSQLC